MERGKFGIPKFFPGFLHVFWTDPLSTVLHFLICLDEFPILNDGGGQGGTSNCFIGKIFILEDFLLKLVIVFTLYRYWYQQISVNEKTGYKLIQLNKEHKERMGRSFTENYIINSFLFSSVIVI